MSEKLLIAKLDELISEVRALRRHSSGQSFTCKEAAEILRTDRHRLARLVKAGLVRAHQDGRRWKIPREEIERIDREGMPSETARVGRPRKPARTRTAVDDILNIKI